MKKIILYFILCHSLLCFARQQKKAVVIVPVADLVGQKIQSVVESQQIEQAYNQIPISLDKSQCLRIQQLLFNEVVDILKERGQEVYIRIPHLFYLRPPSNEPQANYWLLKKNIISFDKIKQRTNDLTKIPPPLSFKNSNQSTNKNIVVLREPWLDSHTQQIFSAGTRFVSAKRNKKETDVYIFNPQTMQYEVKTIPNNKLVTYVQQNPQWQRKNFINLLRQWAQRDEGFIPYVLGGFSFTTITKKPFCKAIYNTVTKDAIPCFVRKDMRATPKTGLDCVGMIARAAQIYGIPFFYKNTTTIKQCLSLLTTQDKLMEGDIIWVPGHVMVVADLVNNTLIEARGYDHGYGKVQEISLNEQFQGINTFHDLINAYHMKKIVTRLDCNGNEQNRITNLTLLRLID